MASLEVHVPGRPVFRVPLGTGEFVIGRGEGCSLQIVEPYVSGRHVSIHLKAVVRDLGSTNGTHVGGKRVTEYVLSHNESIQIGGPDGARLTLHADAGAPDSTVDFASAAPQAAELERLRAQQLEQNREIDQLRRRAEEAERKLTSAPPAARGDADTRAAALQGEVARLEQEVARLRSAQPIKTAPAGAPAPDTTFLARIGELQEKLRREQAARGEAESRLAVLSRSGFSGAQEAIHLVQERDKSIEQLNQALADARRRLDAVEGGQAASGSAELSARALLDSFSTTGEVGLEAAVIELMGRRPELFTDGGFVLGKMYRFSRDLEGVITRMAQHYRGGVADADVTMIPGVMGNLSRAVHALLLRGGDKPRKELDAYLEQLRAWSGICLTAYKNGAKQWCRETLQRISPDAIARTAKIPTWKRALALEGWEYWRCYRRQMEDVTPDIAEAQIDEFAAGAAVDLAKKKGIW